MNCPLQISRKILSKIAKFEFKLVNLFKNINDNTNWNHLDMTRQTISLLEPTPN